MFPLAPNRPRSAEPQYRHGDSNPGSIPASRMFTFTMSSADPVARVRCHCCGWEATGDVPKDVFPLADDHVCVVLR